MATHVKRDNAYYLNRLIKLGRKDLLSKISAGQITVYAAAIEAGLRKRRSEPSKANHLSYHWSRASMRERKRFMIDNFKELDELRRHLVQLIIDNASEAEKLSD